jgi:hypothetical protein
MAGKLPLLKEGEMIGKFPSKCGKRRKLEVRVLILCGFLLAFLPSLAVRPVSAQMTTGVILGAVSDSSGGAVPGANVTVINVGTGVPTKAVTDSLGAFYVPYLVPGTYDVAAEKAGFAKVTKTGIVLQVDQKARVDLTLQVGAVTQSITVQSQSPLVETESSQIGQVITSRTITEMPLAERNFALLVNLNTGAAPGSPPSAPESVALNETLGRDNLVGVTATQMNGVEENGNQYYVDGAPNNEAFFGGLAVLPSVDAIQEFKSSTNDYSAEYGRVGGALTQIAIKPGTNQFHGVVYEFVRNNIFDANDFFANAAGIKIPPYRQNDFGGAIGGPIKKDKAFFFVDYEGFRSISSVTGETVVPDADQRIGDFSEPGNPQLYNPFNLVAGQPQPFPGNTLVGTGLINKAGFAALNMLPSPNLSVPLGQSNFAGLSDLLYDNNKADARIDYNISDKDRLLFRYSALSGILDISPFMGWVAEGPGYGGSPPANANTWNQNAVLAWTHSFTSNTLNEARFGWNFIDTRFASANPNPNWDTQNGIPGANTCGSTLCSGPSGFSVAGLQSGVGGPNSFGAEGFEPTVRYNNWFDWVDNVTLIRGKHTLKFGADIRQERADLNQTYMAAGTFSFDPTYTSDLGASGTGAGAASLLLGYPESSYHDIDKVYPDRRAYYAAAFFQDDYRVSSRLTLNLGLRFEKYTGTTDAHNELSNFNDYTATLQIACIATTCTGGIRTPPSWQPRFGFAYSLDSSRKTVIRGGIGMSTYSSQANSLDDNYPYIVAQSYSPFNSFTINQAVDLPLTSGFPVQPPPVQKPGMPPGNYWFPLGYAVSAYYGNPYNKLPGVMSYDLDLQRQITPNLMLDVAYVANEDRHVGGGGSACLSCPMPGQDLINPVTGQPNSLQQRSPYYNADPGEYGVSFGGGGGRITYQSLQAKLNKRFSNGLSFLLGYTYSKDSGTGQYFNNPWCTMCQNSIIGINLTQRFVASYSYQLPFGRGKHFGSTWNRGEDAVLGGWQVSGITSYQTGFPFTPSWDSSSLDNGQSNQPNRICNGRISNPTIAMWYNINCFVEAPHNVYGNSGYNILTGPGFSDWDVSVMKNFRLTESKSLQFRWEFYNTSNTPQFDLPNSGQCGGFCGEGTVTNMSINYNPRLMQVGLKLYF